MSLHSQKQLDTRFAILSALGMIFIVDGHLNGSYFDIGGLFPYFLWNFVYGVITQILLLAGFSIGEPLSFYNLFVEPFISGHQFVYNLAAWFVPALFLVESVNMLLRYRLKKYMKNEFINTLFYLAIGIGGLSLSFLGKHNGVWRTLVRTMFLFPTYQFGILYKSELEKREPRNNLLYLGFIIISQLYLHVREYRLAYEVVFCRNFTGYILPYITVITGIIFWLRVSSILAPAFKESKLIAFFGSHTYTVMLHHLTVLMVIKTIFAFIAKYTSMFTDFNFEQYKSNIWYYYYPKNLPQFRMIYLILAITIPLSVEYIYEKFICRWIKSFKYQ